MSNALFITENIINEQGDVTESEQRNHPLYAKIKNAQRVLDHFAPIVLETDDHKLSLERIVANTKNPTPSEVEFKERLDKIYEMRKKNKLTLHNKNDYNSNYLRLNR